MNCDSRGTPRTKVAESEGIITHLREALGDVFDSKRRLERMPESLLNFQDVRHRGGKYMRCLGSRVPPGSFSCGSGSPGGAQDDGQADESDQEQDPSQSTPGSTRKMRRRS